MKTLRLCLLAWLIWLTTLAACTDYDHDIPDTAANLAGFERHFDFVVPSDVTDVFYFADEMGADVLYQLGFEAAPGTVERIVKALDLAPAAGGQEMGVGLAYDFPWWDEKDFQQAALYQKANDNQDYWRELWYSETPGRVYYLEFSL